MGKTLVLTRTGCLTPESENEPQPKLNLTLGSGCRQLKDQNSVSRDSPQDTRR